MNKWVVHTYTITNTTADPDLGDLGEIVGDVSEQIIPLGNV
jgi:hypothetical protein